jgi:F0F1-type ATP synthase assembly protein I
MLWTICVLLFALWLLGMLTSHTLGGLIYILPLVALAIYVFHVIQGRKRVAWLRKRRI